MDIQLFLDFHTVLIVGLIYISLHFLKAFIAAYYKSFRNSVKFKKIVLPILGVLLGALFALVLSPEALDSVYEQLSYGVIVGFFWTYFYRTLKGLLPFEKKVEEKLSNSIRPPEGEE